jgi:hypothetical protein
VKKEFTAFLLIHAKVTVTADDEKAARMIASRKWKSSNADEVSVIDVVEVDKNEV